MIVFALFSRQPPSRRPSSRHSFSRRSLKPIRVGVGVVLLSMFGSLLATTGVAGAAEPIAGTSYTGLSAAGRYTVALTPSCSDPNEGSYCFGATAGIDTYMPPANVAIVLTTHPKPGSGCKSSGYEFDPTPIKANGSFTTTAYFTSGSPQLTFTVSGQWVSIGTVRGSITGNFGCGTAAFAISLKPAPIVSTAPCAMLTDVKASRILGIAPTKFYENSSNDSFSTVGGECQVETGGTPGTGLRFISGLELRVGNSPAALESAASASEGEGYQKHQAVAGLGAGAMLYINNKYDTTTNMPTSNIFDFEVDFHVGKVWASLGRTPDEDGCECYSPAAYAGQLHRVIALAHAIRPLLR